MSDKKNFLARKEQLKARRDKLSTSQQTLLEKRLEGHVKAEAIAPRPNAALAPLSLDQQRLWFLSQFAPESFHYNIPTALRLYGTLHYGVLIQSMAQIIQRHEILRTSFHTIDKQPMQIINQDSNWCLLIVDLSGLPVIERESHLWQIAEEEVKRPFTLTLLPLLRTILLKLNHDEHVLILNVHHIISDALSHDIFFQEFATFYRAAYAGQSAVLPDLPIQYGDYAYWQQQWLQSEKLKEQLHYWKQNLQNAPSLLQLPVDKLRPAVQAFQGASCTRRLSIELTKALHQLAHGEGVTLFMLLLAVYQVLLYRYTWQQQIVVGFPVANRNREELEKLIGFFVNTLVVCIDFSGSPTFRQILAQVQQKTLSAYEHRDIPFERIVEEIQPARDISYMPLVQAMFTVQHAGSEEKFALPDLQAVRLDIGEGIIKFDLSLFMNEADEGLCAVLVYNTYLFEESTMARMMIHLEMLLQNITAALDSPVATIPLLTDEEQKRLLIDWNQTQYGGGTQKKFVHQSIAEQASDALALSARDMFITYNELNRRANQLAHYLQKLGVGPDVLVAICLERSPDLIISCLAVLRAGGGYIPLDPDYPSRRLAFMIADSKAVVVLTKHKWLDELQSALIVDPEGSCQFIDLDVDWPVGAPEHLPSSQVLPENLAYVIYTSGSTGQPKGVPVTHSSLLNLVYWHQRQCNISASDRMTLIASVSFDASVLEIWPYLAAGANLHIPNEETRIDVETLRDWLTTNGITVSYIPTPLAEQLLLLLPWPEGAKLRLMLTGGDRLHFHPSPDLPFQVGNCYGPTENAVVTTFEFVPTRGRYETLPTIGRPIDNVQVYLLDSDLQPVPVGVSGELYISGVGLARGYYRHPALTAKQFIPNPFSEINSLALSGSDRLYRTGDLARFLADGRIEFLDRVDLQVKIRGFRIELGEIEAILRQYKMIRDIAVVVREGTNNNKQIVAYVIPAYETNAFTINKLKDFGQQQLPTYMMPDIYIILDKLPLTPNGKLDRQMLPSLPETIIPALKNYEAPQTPIQVKLANIWAKLLKHEQIGINDNFFDLGGHSLLLTQVKSDIYQTLHVKLPLLTLFQNATIAQQAEHIDQILYSNPPNQQLSQLTISHQDRLPLSFAQQRLWFLEQLQTGEATYNIVVALRLTGSFNTTIFEQSLNQIVDRHAMLRTTFPVFDELPVQKIVSDLKINLSIIDLKAISKQRREDIAYQLVSEEAQRPFDLIRGPLIRAKTLQLEAEVHILLFTMHHIISDAWSMNILAREVVLLYQAIEQNKPIDLPPLPIQYTDFAFQQRAWLEEGGMAEQLHYWQKQLEGSPPALELPTDYPRPAIQTFNGGVHTFTISKPMVAALKTLAQQESATLFMTLLAVFKVLLYRYTNQEDILVGSPIANRNWPNVEDMIGFFVNVIVLRTKLTGNLGFRELLRQIRETALNAYIHQELPFEYLVEKLQPKRDLSHTPLFQVMFSLQNTPNTATFSLPGLFIEPVSVQNNTAKFDLTMVLEEGLTGAMTGVFEFNCDLFNPSTIEQMVSQFQRLISAIVDNPDAKIDNLLFLPPEMIQKLLLDWNCTQKTYPQEKHIYQWFEAQAEENPERIAISFCDDQITYKKLNQMATQLAHYLQKCGVGPETLVGVCMDRSLEMILGLIAIMKAGGAYVPLDPQYPQERLAFMLVNAQVPILLTQAKLRENLPDCAAEVICVDELEFLLPQQSIQNITPQLTGNSAAYMIYTSGSTGKPKGVINKHSAILNRLLWMQDRYQLTETDCILQKTPFSFDVSVWEFFWPLMFGARLVIAEPEGHKNIYYLCKLIAEQNVTVMHFVPSMLQLFLEEPTVSEYDGLRHVICSGEALPVELNNRFFDLLNAELHNLYGPTEAAIDVSSWACQPHSKHQSVPIGRPIANVTLYILNKYFQPVPVGVVGELYIGGEGLARGYHSQPGLTAEKFLPNPFNSSSGGSRLYKTGDLACFRQDGNIEFLGRIDHQVKIHGLRIELGEIEAILNQHPAVRESVVITGTNDRLLNDQLLIAYIVPKDEQASTIHKVLRLKKQDLSAGLSWYELPEDDLIIVSLNENETDFMYQEIFIEEVYLQHGITIQPGDCIFDVGANIGLFSLYMARKYPHTFIYAFEPLPTAFTALSLNKELYDVNARLFAYGLADENKEATITYYPHNTIISGRFADKSADRRVVTSFLKNKQDVILSNEELDELLAERMVTLTVPGEFKTVSQVLKEQNVEKIGLLKIDVEKSEWDVLSGIEPDDWFKIRQIVVEVHDIDNRVNQIKSLLEKHSYQVTIQQDRLLAGTGLYNLYAVRPELEVARTKSLPLTSAQIWHSPTALIRDLTHYVKEKVPEYMVPNVFTLLNEMPLTPNGKLNRPMLPPPERLNINVYVAPRDDIEHQLVHIWESLLHTEKIGIYDNFFELGGHSLLTVRLMGQIRQQFEQEVSLSSFFKGPTIAQVSEGLRQGGVRLPSVIVGIQPEGEKPPLFCVHPVDGTIFCYLELARLLGQNQPFYGIQFAGLYADQIEPFIIHDMARDYIEAIRKVQAKGPYYLAGWSLGGGIALEIAQQLSEQGDSVATLILIDSYPLQALNLLQELDESIWWANFAELPNPFIDEKEVEKQPKLKSYYALNKLVKKGDRTTAFQDEVYQHTDKLFRIYEANIRATMKYTIPPYSGQVVLLRAEASIADIPDALGGWHNFDQNKVRVHVVEGSSHFNILHLPQVETVAKILHSYLP